MIKVKNLNHFYGKDHVLKDIDIEINKGDFVVLLGESGSGKSTLLSILSTLLKNTSGEVFIEEINIKEIKNIDKFRNEKIGFIFQFHYLINYMSVKENIKLVNKNITENQIEDMLNKLSISELSEKNPTEISGGQKQRVAIARALINKPKILFGDEPTGNLDSKNSENVFKLFKELSEKGTTIVVATHDKEMAKYANKIIRLKDGKIQ